jgi:hypothetical protein
MSILPLNAHSFTVIQDSDILDESTIFCKHKAILKYQSVTIPANQKFSLVIDIIRNSLLANHDYFKLNIFCNFIIIYSKKVDCKSCRINLDIYNSGDLYFYFEISLLGATPKDLFEKDDSIGIYFKPVLEKEWTCSEGMEIFINSTHTSLINLGFNGIYLKKPSVSKLQHDILKALSYGEPFSCIRVGDGEGKLLGFPDFYKDIDIVFQILNYQFGGDSTGLLVGSHDQYSLSEQILILKGFLTEAISNADFVGVPVADFIENKFQNKNQLSGHIAYSIAFNYCLLTRKDLIQNSFVGTNIFQLLCTHTNFMRVIIKRAKRVFYIYPINIQDELKKIEPEKVFIHIPISGHATYPVSNSRYGQFPFNYHYTCNQINSYGDLSGDLFLIAGGIMGKHFANLVKKNGGVGLDVGSIFDSWIKKGLPYAVNNEVPSIEMMPSIDLDEWSPEFDTK